MENSPNGPTATDINGLVLCHSLTTSHLLITPNRRFAVWNAWILCLLSTVLHSRQEHGMGQSYSPLYISFMKLWWNFVAIVDCWQRTKRQPYFRPSKCHLHSFQ
jgi:hypothetical protein